MKPLIITTILFLIKNIGISQIANGYYADQGIENNQNVIFTEMFEDTSINQMMLEWSSKSNITTNILLDNQSPIGSTGNQCLHLNYE